MSESNIQASVQGLKKSNKIKELTTESPVYTGRLGLDVEVKPHVAENDNTRVAHKPMGLRSPEDTEGSSFMDGVKRSLKEAQHTWKYVENEAKKLVEDDPGELAKIEANQDEILMENMQLPEVRGMGKVGAGVTDIVALGAPLILSAFLGGPKTAAAVGVGIGAFDLARSAAQANMEMDQYEKATGEKIDPAQRNAYTTATVATDVVMNTLTGSKYLSKVAAPVKTAISKELKARIMQNPVAQAEFNTMTRHVMRQERGKWAGDAAKNATSSAIEGGVMSGAKEAERSIYTGDAPELGNIVNSVLSGAAEGATYGGGSTAVRKEHLHQQRKNQDDVFYSSNTTHKVGSDRSPIAEFRPQTFERDADGNIVAVEGYVVDPTGNHKLERIPVENISTGSYKEADLQGATRGNRDNWKFTKKQISEYNAKWEESMEIKKSDPEKAYQMQNEVLQSMATQMGVPINVYASLKDLPPELKKHEEVLQSYGVTVNDNSINFVLDQCETLKAENLPAIIRHEAVGHFGLPKIYETDMDYEKALYRAGTSLVPVEKRRNMPTPKHGKAYTEWMRRLEERASRRAEPRVYIQETEPDHEYHEIYKMLRKSEDNIRSTTVNELKKNSNRRGNPMPGAYELEQQKKKKGK